MVFKGKLHQLLDLKSKLHHQVREINGSTVSRPLVGAPLAILTIRRHLSIFSAKVRLQTFRHAKIVPLGPSNLDRS